MNLGPEHWRSKFSDFLQHHHRSFLSVYANIPRRIGKSELWEYNGKFKTFASSFLESQGSLLPPSPSLLSLAMLTPLRLYLLLAALSTLVVSECGPWSVQPSVYADCQATIRSLSHTARILPLSSNLRFASTLSISTITAAAGKNGCSLDTIFSRTDRNSSIAASGLWENRLPLISHIAPSLVWSISLTEPSSARSYTTCSGTRNTKTVDSPTRSRTTTLPGILRIDCGRLPSTHRD